MRIWSKALNRFSSNYKYKSHVYSLAEDLSCQVYEEDGIGRYLFASAWADPRNRVIHIPKLNDSQSYIYKSFESKYVTAIHELAHVDLKHFGDNYWPHVTLKAEAEAWLWTLNNLKREVLTDEIKRFISYSLNTYFVNRNDWKYGEPDETFWYIQERMEVK